ncbi:MAG: hypothetical protein ABIO35_10900 [Nitrobacter sp.]
MSYSRTRPQAALGDTWSDTLSSVKAMTGSVDPYLPEILCRIDKIRALRKKRTMLQAILGEPPTVPVPTCVSMPPGLPGVGIEFAVTPLRITSWVVENPLLAIVGLATAVAVPYALGYSVGRRSKR